MQIYLKCSFKSSEIGYRIGNYSPKSDVLTPISEDDVFVRQKMSHTIADTLQTQLGRSMLLAADEDGCLFVGIYGLVFGEYEKYVNAVFTGEDPQEIFQIFLYFCSNYNNANKQLLASVVRSERFDSETGFAVDSAQIHSLLNNAGEINCPDAYQFKGNDLLVFAAKGTFSDCKIGLSRIFDTPPIIQIDHIKDDAIRIESAETIIKTIVKRPKKLYGYILLFTVVMLVIIIAVTISYLYKKVLILESPEPPKITQNIPMDENSSAMYGGQLVGNGFRSCSYYAGFNNTKSVKFCSLSAHSVT